MSVSVSLIGAGLVGKEVLSQLSSSSLSKKFRIDLITNSRYQVTLPLGQAQAPALDLLAYLPKSSADDTTQQWTQDPKTGAVISRWSIDELVETLIARKEAEKEIPSVVVDCTSDQKIAEKYPALLSAGIHLVTPNKKAFSGSQSLYDSILSAKQSSKALVYQESTVGAGLPVIGPLKDLVETGDEIYKAEGVVSGTFSYVFNEFSKPSDQPAPKFSQVVKLAKEAGFTEPNPADDLNGSDVARKLCILARLIPASTLPSLPEGFASVPTDSLVPKELESVTDGNEFMQRLPEFDDHFENLRKEAFEEGKVLRYVGVVDVKNGKLKAGLEKYPFAHPFAASLSGSDCILSFTTKRYPSPLIIQGSGAGAAVTAMGCVGDLLKIHERVAQ